MTMTEAGKAFGFFERQDNIPTAFLFGSVDSLLSSTNELFEMLNQQPFYTYINIGFEAVDAPTLKLIGKPLSEFNVREAFLKMCDINAAYNRIEITGNFLMGETLSHQHFLSLAELLNSAPDPVHGKGAIYLSPIMNSPNKRELLPQYYELKKHSRLPVYVYLIQRL